MSSTPSAKKKRKANDSSSTTSKKQATANVNSEMDGFEPYKLETVRSKILALCSKIPEIPEAQFEDLENLDENITREWAMQLQAVLEEFNLLVCCVATATYKWGSERSGAGDQNLGLLSGELAASQEQISSTVTPRLTNVLAPVVDLVIEKIVTTKNEEGLEVKENIFTQKLVDPAFVKLCHRILARNAPLLRQVVLSNFHKLLRCLKDYLNAQKNDAQHNRSFTY